MVATLALAGVTLLPGRPLAGRSEGLDPRRVAVATLSNETGDRRLGPLGAQVGDWITDRISGLQGVEVVTSATTVPGHHHPGGAADQPERLRALAEETRAGTLVAGSYYREPKGSVEFHIEIVDANSGEVVRAIGPVDATGDSERVADELSRDVAGALDGALRATSVPTPGVLRTESRPPI
jgi:TolB-like protein